MNLIVPVNLQALRVSPNDASLVTKNSDYFAGPSTSFDQLPWRDAGFVDRPGRASMANISANVVNPIAGRVEEQLGAGVHLHWALPDGLARGKQMADGSIVFPAAPNRWLITRVIRRGGACQARQWILESDRLMSDEAYQAYFSATGRKAVSIPVGWTLLNGSDPSQTGGALYYPPSRRMGQVFDLANWRPEATPVGATPDQVLHLDEIQRGANPFTAQARTPEPLKAVDGAGVVFAAYYPDCRSIFGFHDRFADLGDGFDLADAAFDVSYHLVGWHSHEADDPLKAKVFADALARSVAADAKSTSATPRTPVQQAADAVSTAFGWLHDADKEQPARCLYSGQAVGLGWDTTRDPTGADPSFPKCYLTPPADDATARLALGSSVSGAMAALVRHEWKSWTGGEWTPPPEKTPEIEAQIEKDLEFLLDALQLGLLHKIGASHSLPQLEQALHQSGFGSEAGGQLWAVRAQPTEPVKNDPKRFDPPPPSPPIDDNDLGGKLDRLNVAQARLNDLQSVIESCGRQIYLDWTHYISAVGSGAADPDSNKLTEELKTYISGQVLDLWAKREAAYGLRTAASPATGNVPVFYSDAATSLAFVDGRYASPSPPPSLAGQVAAAANAVLDVLAKPAYAKFGLERMEEARFWQPQEVVAVATADSLKPARRNGAAKYLPCRLSSQVTARLEASSGAAKATLTAGDAASTLGLAVPSLSGQGTPEAQETLPLLGDIKALSAEACLLDPVSASAWASGLTSLGDASLQADLPAAIGDALAQIRKAWLAGAPISSGAKPVPEVLADVAAQAGGLSITLVGQAPQGAGVTLAPSTAETDVFLPLYLVWEAKHQPFEKGQASGAGSYDPGFLNQHFTLDPDSIDLTVGTAGPRPTPGAVTVSGSIPLSSRAAEPLIDQIRQYLAENPAENPELEQIITHLKDKPLLSQGLSGVNPALISRAQGLQMEPFDPFYDTEPPAALLSPDPSTLVFANVLTHFVAQAAGASDQAPLVGGAFNPLRTGYFSVSKIEVVDVFGRKRALIDASLPTQADRIVVSATLTPPPATAAQMLLPPRLVQPSRLQFDWMSAADAQVVSNDHPSTTPICGWVVSNYIDNSLMLFAASGAAVGSLGVFGSQAQVAWQSAPGRPARTLDQDLGAPELAPLAKFARFILGKPRAMFDDLMASIESAHTYILPDANAGEQPYAVLMGRPMALVRAGLRLEFPGLPAFATDLDGLRATIEGSPQVYDWTRRQAAGVLDLKVPVRLGDRNHLSDGLVAYLLEDGDAYDRIYAPAAPDPNGQFVRTPAKDTLLLTPHARLDPPPVPYPDRSAQAAALSAVQRRSARTPVTMLIDPRASVHATTGLLPIKGLELPDAIYRRAFETIEAYFFTHPVLRGAQGLSLPTPDEAGFTWRWTTAVKQGGVAQPHDEDLVPYQIGDRAHFNFSPQVAQDGWLKLTPKPDAPLEPK